MGVCITKSLVTFSAQTEDPERAPGCLAGPSSLQLSRPIGRWLPNIGWENSIAAPDTTGVYVESPFVMSKIRRRDI